MHFSLHYRRFRKANSRYHESKFGRSLTFDGQEFAELRMEYRRLTIVARTESIATQTK